MGRAMNKVGWMCCIGVVVLLAAGPPARATDISWNVAEGSWNTAANWSPQSVPAAGDDAIVNNQGTCHVDAAAMATCHDLVLGATSNGQGWLMMDIAGGTLDIASLGNIYVGKVGEGTFVQQCGVVLGPEGGDMGFYVGHGANSVGVYQMSGGNLGGFVDGSIGGGGVGKFFLSGGTANPAGDLFFVGGMVDEGSGTESSGIGYLEISGGVFGYQGYPSTYVGRHGQGTIAQTGGKSHFYSLLLGAGEDSFGYCKVSGGSMLPGNVAMGAEDGSRGSFVMTGGTVLAATMAVSCDDKASGTFRLDAGAYCTAESLYVSQVGDGLFVQTGGTLLLTNSGNLTVSYTGEANGRYVLDGGYLFADGIEKITYWGDGEFTQNGGHHRAASFLILSGNAGHPGTYNLNGGSLSVDILAKGTASGVFNWTGGTLTPENVWNDVNASTPVDLTNTDGVLRPRGPGGTVTTIRGNYTQDDDGKLLIDLNGRTTCSRVEVDDAYSEQGGTATLGGTLWVEHAGTRPREYDKFTVIIAKEDITTDFDTIGTNITLGQYGSVPFWARYMTDDPNYYVLRFQGLTNGDANGDHAVDGGDLSIIGGNWLEYDPNFTWADADFNGDHYVDGGDLALMVWGWTRPDSAPPAPIPEPASLCALGCGAVALLRRRRR